MKYDSCVLDILQKKMARCPWYSFVSPKAWTCRRYQVTGKNTPNEIRKAHAVRAISGLGKGSLSSHDKEPEHGPLRQCGLDLDVDQLRPGRWKTLYGGVVKTVRKGRWMSSSLRSADDTVVSGVSDRF